MAVRHPLRQSLLAHALTLCVLKLVSVPLVKVTASEVLFFHCGTVTFAGADGGVVSTVEDVPEATHADVLPA